jgi:hypothetical protein
VAEPYVPRVSFDYDPVDPPSPLAVARGIFGGALILSTLGIIVILLDSGHVDSHLLAFIGTLWVFWGLVSDVFGVATWLGRIVGGQITGMADGGPPLRIDIDQETVMLERLIAAPPAPPAAPHREILAGIRLAEIYRTHQHDPAKSAALLDHLRTKYPEAPELMHDLGGA